MGHCRDCRHWDVSWGGEGGTACFFDEATKSHKPIPGEWGECQAVRHLGGGGPRSPFADSEPEVGAFLSDGSGYFASLSTRADFGCVLFEELTLSPTGGA